MSRWLNPASKIKEKSLKHRDWLKTVKGQKYKKRHRKYAKEWRKKFPNKFHTTQKKCYAKVRLEALVHYSQDPPSCKCCGETKLYFLTFDHINGDGSKHRKKIGMAQGVGKQKYKIKVGGNGLAYWLKKKNWPAGFQVLCYNCNCAKRTFKCCPCQEKSIQ
jgi:hypothetical protein